jgi:hypothetical protein
LLLIGLCVLLLSTAARAAEPPPQEGLNEPELTASDRAHWAFRPLSPASPPAIKHAGWCINPVDRFILKRLDEVGLTPLPPADKHTLIRRVTFDLTGLPPTPAESAAFVADDSPDAYERLLERLLASPAYGERWAQHWLDLARFAETDGFEHDLVRPHAWRYRDWVIDALNRDLPFDEFVRLQIAGDELAPDDPAAAIATGFLLCGPDMPDINLQDERRHTVLNELTSTVGAALLGLQIGCAQCHNHKFDPLSQADFYRLRAFFESADIFKEHPIPTSDEAAAWRQAEAELGDAPKVLAAKLKDLEETARKRIREKNPDLQPKPADLPAALTADERRQHAEASVELAQLKKLPALPLGRVVREGKPQQSYLMVRGDFRRRGPEVAAGVPRVVPVSLAAISNEEQPSSGGRRTELARWLTQPEHPLVTRVIVNRLWQQHFGTGLVPSSSDFGRMGDEPSHPELLDWLASELPRQGWSLKRLHRLLLSSATYRQASRPSSPGWTAAATAAAQESWKKSRQADPQNRWLARMSRQRLEGEAIRDAMLAAADRLSPRRGGPGVRPPLPQELVSTLLKNQWEVTPNVEDHRRRGIYLFVRRNLRYPLFEAFDRPDTNASCPRRNRSTIAPQALMLLNSEFSLAAARDLAGFLLQNAGGDPAAQIELAYQRTLGRQPSEDELRTGREFLAQQAAELKAASRSADSLALPARGADRHTAAALVDFCLALFNLNEFVYVD